MWLGHGVLEILILVTSILTNLPFLLNGYHSFALEKKSKSHGKCQLEILNSVTENCDLINLRD